MRSIGYTCLVLRCFTQANDTATPCVATWELENWMESGQDPNEEEVIKNTTAIVYAGELTSNDNAKFLLIFHSDSWG